MKALRIILTQNSANYRKEETQDNKTTYPLPPFSTVIGALHVACGYKEYHPMNISIQGNYESLYKKPYTDYCLQNSTMDDRGILIKSESPVVSKAFTKVAKAVKTTGNSFKDERTIDVLDRELLSEYQALKQMSNMLGEFKKNRIDRALTLIKRRKTSLSNKRKKLADNKELEKLVASREKQVKELEKRINNSYKEYKQQNYDIPYSKFYTLTTSLKYYELLHNIKLIIHVQSDAQTLQDVLDNIYNLKSIGRSEDFVQVESAELVELADNAGRNVRSKYSAYIDYELLKSRSVFNRRKEGIPADGTKYMLNKDYKIENKKRVFNKRKVVYTSNYAANARSAGLFFDFNGDECFIVNFN